MISGVEPAAEAVGVKSDSTDHEGLARRLSRSTEGLLVEEYFRVTDALVSENGWDLRVGKVLRQGLGIMAQLLRRDAFVAGHNVKCQQA